jgi:hypothetical protein
MNRKNCTEAAGLLKTSSKYLQGNTEENHGTPQHIRPPIESSNRTWDQAAATPGNCGDSVCYINYLKWFCGLELTTTRSWVLNYNTKFNDGSDLRNVTLGAELEGDNSNRPTLSDHCWVHCVPLILPAPFQQPWPHWLRQHLCECSNPYVTWNLTRTCMLWEKAHRTKIVCMTQCVCV